MTLEQLNTIVSINGGLQSSIAYRAARMVLVEGLTQTEAKRQLGESDQAIQAGVTRYRKLDQKIRDAYLKNETAT